MKTKLDKGQMIDRIIGVAKGKAILENRFFNGGDMFFQLCFKSDSDLKKICKKIGVL